MGHEHAAHAAGPSWVAALVAAAAGCAAAAYLLGAWRLHHRGDSWPRNRDVSFVAGCAGLVAAALGSPPGGVFTAHMTQHLLVGMVAPLLLVLARPATLALRVLRPGPARRALLAAAHSRPVTALVFPPVAALLDVGGLWVLYRSPLFAATQHEPWLHGVVHLHVFAAGVLFTAAVCQLDPLRHRYSMVLRAAALIGAGAAHAVLAKTLYAAPPPSLTLPLADVRLGAQLMYYGGDLVEIGLALVIALQWYAAGGRSLRHQRRRLAPAGPGPASSSAPHLLERDAQTAAHRASPPRCPGPSTET